jgi:hypothetical protein
MTQPGSSSAAAGWLVPHPDLVPFELLDEAYHVVRRAEVALDRRHMRVPPHEDDGSVRVSATTSCPAAARCGVSTDPRKAEAPVTTSFTQSAAEDSS